jgi:hypothetical protein
VEGCCEDADGPTYSIKVNEFLEQLSEYRMPQKSVNWLVKCTLKYVINSLLLTEFTNFFEMRSSMFNAQFTTL